MTLENGHELGNGGRQSNGDGDVENEKRLERLEEAVEGTRQVAEDIERLGKDIERKIEDFDGSSD